MAGGGSQLHDTEAFRYGGTIGDNCQFRIYGKHFEEGAYPYVYSTMGPADDSWRQGRFGFRVDWQPDQDKSNTFTIQGDHYLGTTNNSVIPTATTIGDHMTGQNVLARWRHVYNDQSDWTLQMYYDNYMRQNALQTQIDTTLDIDFQYRFPVGDRHSITCGAAFRNVHSHFAGGDAFSAWFPQPPAVPNVTAPDAPDFTTNYPSQFVQDEISLVDDRLVLTLGCKLEENPYTGLEYQPNIRLLYAPDKRHSFWGAISRAVHTPSRSEEQCSFTATCFYPVVYQRIQGSDQAYVDLSSESMIAYELGYREQTTRRFSWDIATFYNVYDGIITPDLVGTPYLEYLPSPPHFVIPATYQNGPSGTTYGVELFGTYELTKRWRFSGQYTLFHMNWLNTNGYYNGWDPKNMFYLRSSWNVRENLDFDAILRYCDTIPMENLWTVPAYLTMDLRLAWRPTTHLELAVVGQNLFQDYHVEYNPVGMAYGSAVPRSVYGTATWRF